MPTSLESIIVTACVFVFGGVIGWAIGWAFYPHQTRYEGPSDDEPYGDASTYQRKARS